LRERAIGMNVRAVHIPDNLSTLWSLRDSGRLVTTPKHDYDDAYAIQFAYMNNDAYIVSNDKYRDHVSAQPPNEQRKIIHWYTCQQKHAHYQFTATTATELSHPSNNQPTNVWIIIIQIQNEMRTVMDFIYERRRCRRVRWMAFVR